MGIRDWFKPKKNSQTKELSLKFDWLGLGEKPEFSSLFILSSEEDVISALEAWNWLPLTHLSVCAVSAFGEVFFRNETGKIIQLDTIKGSLSKVSDSTSDFVAQIKLEDVQDKLLLAGFIFSMRNNGSHLEKGECYDFKIPPILGGAFHIDNIEKTSFIVKLDIAGQIHQQVKDLPDGTEIGEIIVKD